MTLGQEFDGYAACIRRGADDVDRASEQLRELNIGATAVGTGLNAGDDYRRLVVRESRPRDTACTLIPALDLFRVTQSMGDVLAYSSAVRRLAIEVGKVASDLRLLSHGPARRPGRDRAARGAARLVDHAGEGESRRSPEMVNQVCFQVVGCDTTVAIACEAGQLELNVMMPVIAWNALHASTILRESITVLAYPLRGRHSSERRPRARAARPEHGDGHRSQPVYRLRCNRRDREGVDRDGTFDQGPRARAGSDGRGAARCDPVARSHDARGRRRLFFPG